MSQLLGIPVPSSEQLIVGAELVILLFPVRLFTNALYARGRHERNRIIKHHVKSGHEDRLKQCGEDYCPSLRNPSALIEADLEVDP